MSEDREPIEVREYEDRRLRADQLTGSDTERLRRLGSSVLRLSEARDGWVITAGAVTGVLVLDRVRLLLLPKLQIDGS
jgi:5-methylcytosine-specific restriction enzyme subunit McrC